MYIRFITYFFLKPFKICHNKSLSDHKKKKKERKYLGGPPLAETHPVYIAPVDRYLIEILSIERLSRYVWIARSNPI